MGWGIIVAPHVGCVIRSINTLVPHEFSFRSGMINQIDYPDLVNSIEPHETFDSVIGSLLAYPNPFNTTTKIKFDLPKPETVKIEVCNIIGQKIQTLLNKSMPAGYHEVEFNGQNLSSGIYLYRIEAGAWQDVKKMVYLK
jgi:hypothetical protein